MTGLFNIKHQINIMKRLSVILFVLATVAALVSCSENSVKYTVNGFNAPEEGSTVYLTDKTTMVHIDSAVVSGGTFRIKGKTDKDAFLAVEVNGHEGGFVFFNDGEPVQVDVAGDALTGSALNTKLAECLAANDEAYDEYSTLIKEFLALPEKEQAAKMEEFMPLYHAAVDKYSDFFFGLIEDNMDSLIPVAFMDSVRSLGGVEKFNEFLDSGTMFAQHPYVSEIKRKIDEAAARQKEAEEHKKAFVGQMFTDLEEADPDGNMHKLSEYVGKGKWVLVDFWASWCGPCKREMPNVVAAYKKYKAKGFDVVGLSFDREKEPWVKAIVEWDMPWVHLSDLKYWQTVAADVYGVNSIPDNILINPEGRIVARGLRGTELDAFLASVLK